MTTKINIWLNNHILLSLVQYFDTGPSLGFIKLKSDYKLGWIYIYFVIVS